MLTFIFLCQGGFLFARAEDEKVLSVHYICMSIAWPVSQSLHCMSIGCSNTATADN